MKEIRQSPNAWEKYVSAKKAAFGEAAATGEPATLEELEEQIARFAADAGIPETGMPPRAEVHPTKRSQLSKWFYLTLVLLFAGLVAFLFWWGQNLETSL